MKAEVRLDNSTGVGVFAIIDEGNSVLIKEGGVAGDAVELNWSEVNALLDELRPERKEPWYMRVRYTVNGYNENDRTVIIDLDAIERDVAKIEEQEKRIEELERENRKLKVRVECAKFAGEQIFGKRTNEKLVQTFDGKELDYWFELEKDVEARGRLLAKVFTTLRGLSDDMEANRPAGGWGSD